MAGEERLKEQIFKFLNEEEAVKLGQKLIRIPSENPPGKMDEIVEFVCHFLNENDLNYEIVEGKPGYPNIISRLKGEKDGKTLVLSGHLDVVPAGGRENWDFDPFSGEIKDGYLCGRGASDMKGGIACLLAAYRAASRLPELPGNVILLLVPDEETGGRFGTQWALENNLVDGDGCLIAEPSGANPTVGQKGFCWLKIITEGLSGHGSLSPVAGNNAILKMFKAMEAINSLWEEEWEMPPEIKNLLEDSKKFIKEKQRKPGIERVLDHITVNVGTISGGDKVNKIPDHCEIEVDLRIPFGVETGEVIKLIEKRFKEKNIDAKIEPLRWMSEANYTLPDELIVRSVVENAKKIAGINCTPVLQWASSDARHFRKRGIPTVQYGPAELEGIHSVNERVSVEDLKLFTRVYAGVIVDFVSD